MRDQTVVTAPISGWAGLLDVTPDSNPVIDQMSQRTATVAWATATILAQQNTCPTMLFPVSAGGSSREFETDA